MKDVNHVNTWHAIRRWVDVQTFIGHREDDPLLVSYLPLVLMLSVPVGPGMEAVVTVKDEERPVNPAKFVFLGKVDAPEGIAVRVAHDRSAVELVFKGKLPNATAVVDLVEQIMPIHAVDRYKLLQQLAARGFALPVPVAWMGRLVNQHASPTLAWVAAFAERMEQRLAENRHKGDRTNWLNDAPRLLLMRVEEELMDLRNALEHGAPSEDVWREAANVANMAAMTADSYAERCIAARLGEKERT